MASLPESWRSLLAQQQATTGRGITPTQAAALRSGEIAAQYQQAGAAETRALAAKSEQALEDYRTQQLEQQNTQFGLSQSQQAALSRQAIEAQRELQEMSLGFQSGESEEQRRLAREQLAAQTAYQNATLENQRIASGQDAAAKNAQAAAAEKAGYMSGLSALTMAGLTSYKLYDWLFPSKAPVTETTGGYIPAVPQTGTAYYQQTMAPFQDYGNAQMFDYSIPNYDFSGMDWDVGGLPTYDFSSYSDLGNYDWLNDTSWMDGLSNMDWLGSMGDYAATDWGSLAEGLYGL